MILRRMRESNMILRIMREGSNRILSIMREGSKMGLRERKQ
jgi:hypothetical protein